jgi:hypothetical protein
VQRNVANLDSLLRALGERTERVPGAGLAEKNYRSLYGIRTPAFVLALRERQELFEDAFNRNVMIIGPTTLLIALRTIASIWRYEYQNRNAQELVRQCTALYDSSSASSPTSRTFRQAPEAVQALPGHLTELAVESESAAPQ